MTASFVSLTHPLPGTFSGRGRPCHYDHPAPSALIQDLPGEPAARQSCPFRQFCRDSGHELGKRLEYVYGRTLVVALSETTASIFNRSDQHFRGGEISRNSLRKHFYTTAAREVAHLLCPETLSAVRADARWPATALPVLDELDQLVVASGGKELVLPDDATVAARLTTARPLLTPELLGVLRAYTAETFACRRFAAAECLRSYVGFVDNRRSSPKHPIEMALLAPPRRLLDDPAVRIVTGSYARLFGQVDFPSTFFSMCEGQQGGTSCAETCATMVLGAISDQVPVLQGGFDLAFLASSVRGSPTPSSPALTHQADATCLHRHPRRVRSFEISGLSPKNLAALFERIDGVHGSMFDEHGTLPRGLGDDFLVGLIGAHIDARIPLILHVDGGHIQAHHFGRPVPSESSESGHAVVVIGYRGDLRDPTRSALIIHDPSFGPYQEIGVEPCLRAARAVRLRHANAPTNLVRWNACTPEWLSVHPVEVLYWVARRPIPLGGGPVRIALRATHDLARHGLLPHGVEFWPGATPDGIRRVREQFGRWAAKPHCWAVYLLRPGGQTLRAAYFFVFDDRADIYKTTVFTLAPTGSGDAQLTPQTASRTTTSL